MYLTHLTPNSIHSDLMNITLLIITLLLCIPNPIFSQKSPKRGYGYGYNSFDDIKKMSQGCTWWYNWSNTPDVKLSELRRISDIEFVPMSWGGNPDFNRILTEVPDSGSFYYLGFNEPNLADQANMTPKEAASRWKQLEEVSKRKGYSLVSPAMTYGNVNVTHPVAWLDSFIVNCPSCTFDYIALHWYACDTGSLKDFLSMFKKYRKPLWLTEFACFTGVPGTRGNQSISRSNQYMIQAIEILENDPDVYRYAWFAGRTAAIVNANLLGGSGRLTTLGTTYVEHPFPKPQLIPGRVEAESYYRRKGTQILSCADDFDCKMAGPTQPKDWLEYLTTVSISGSYELELRFLNTIGGGIFHIEMDNKTITPALSIPQSKIPQNWETITYKDIHLSSGDHILKINIDSGIFNLNYFKLNLISPTWLLGNEFDTDLLVYPTIVDDKLTIKSVKYTCFEFVSLYSSQGILIKEFSVSVTSENNILNLEGIGSGSYYLKITTKNGSITKKIIKI